MKYKPLPYWFKYTEFRAFLREAEVDGREFQNPNCETICTLCDFVNDRLNTPFETTRVSYYFLFANGKFYKMPRWATRYQKAAVNYYQEKNKAFLSVRDFAMPEALNLPYPKFPAKEALDILCKTGAFVK